MVNLSEGMELIQESIERLTITFPNMYLKCFEKYEKNKKIIILTNISEYF